MKRRAMRLLLAGSFASMLAVGASPATPAPVSAVSSTFCGSSATAARIAAVLLHSDRSAIVLKALSTSSVRIDRSSNLLRLQRTDQALQATVPVVAPTGMLCLSYPPGAVLLDEATTVSGATFAAPSAALEYREHRAWPAPRPSHPYEPGTSVYVETRGRYYVVHFVDDRALTRAWDSCAGHEYYRVDLARTSVLPFNGCMVGGSQIPLPGLHQLPD